MGTGARLREAFPDVVVAAAEPLPGDPVMGLRSLEDGYVPPILDVSQLDRKILVSNAESVAAVRALLEREGIFAGVSAGAVVHVARRIAEELPAGLGRRRRPRRRRLEVPVGRLLDGRGRRTVDGEHALVVVPEPIRAELHAHAAEEAPNECCGVIVFRDGVAERYLRGRNRLASPVPLRARDRPGGLVPRGRGLRARRLPLAPGDRAAARRAPTASAPASGRASRS